MGKLMRLRVLFGLASLVTLVGMLWGSVAPARACSCIETSVSPYDRADVVVVGTVIRMAKSDASPVPGVVWENLDAVIAVEEYLKGLGPAEIMADDPAHGGLCGYFDEWSVGHRYVVYLSGQASPFQTNYCSGNYELGHASGGDEGPTPTAIRAGPPIEVPPDPPNSGAGPTPSSYFGDGTPAPGPIAAQVGEHSETSAVNEIVGRFDEANGDPPDSERASERLDEESGIGLVPAVAAMVGPLAFLAGAAFLWRRGEAHNG